MQRPTDDATGFTIAVEVLAGIVLTLVLAGYLVHSRDRLVRGALASTR